MKVYDAQHIRNVGFIGHAGTGKTMLAESCLFQVGAINRRGSIEDHNTVCDFHDLENERGCSVFNTLIYTEYKDHKINIIDTPGYDDYIGEVASAMKVVDTAIIAISAQNNIEVGTENGWDYAEKYKTPVVFLVNKMDFERSDFDNTVQELKDRFGHTVTTFQFPYKSGIGFDSIIDILSMSMYKFTPDTNKFEKLEIPATEKAKAEKIRNELIETIAESNEDLMVKFFDEGTLSEEDIKSGLKKALIARQMFPVLCGSSKGNIGTETLLKFIIDVVPAPNEMPMPDTVEEVDIKCSPTESPSFFVFKMISEAHLGDMTFFRAYSGKFSSGMDIYNEQKSASERLSQVFAVCGKKREELSEIQAGDIGATVKLRNTHINDTLHEKGKHFSFTPIAYPKPRIRIAVVPRTKGEEEKVGMGLNSLHLEDPTLVIEHSQELRQLILHAQGELHLSAAKWRLQNRYKVEAEFIEPRVPYRETIQKQVRGSYRHKKQSGGAGQFAEVHMMIEPWYEGCPDPTDLTIRGKEMIDLQWGGKLEYINCIVGGSIDARFFPAILKGVMDKMNNGPLTGCYVRDIRVFIYDGKMHPVDSNEAAFKTAGMMVFKENFVQASPKILEPIYFVEIKIPEEYVGDVMSDLPSRRGVILGIDSDGHYQKIKARMPLAELDKYSTALRSMTQARGTHSQEFAEYQTVPPTVQQELIAANKKAQEEEA